MRFPGSLVGTLVLELRGLLLALDPCNLQQFPKIKPVFFFVSASFFFLFLFFLFSRDSRGASMRFSPLLSVLGTPERFSPKDLFIPLLSRETAGAPQ